MRILNFAILLALGLAAKFAIADDCMWEDSCYKRPPLIENYKYGFHIIFTGQREANQKLFYNIKDVTTGNFIVQNTLITENSIDFMQNLNYDQLNSDDVRNQSKNITLTIFGVKSSLPNGIWIDMAIPISLKINMVGFYAKDEDGSYGNILDYKLYGSVTGEATINKNFSYSFSENPNTMWKTAKENKDHIINSQAWSKKNPNNPNVISNDMIINASIPFATQFISVVQNPTPAITSIQSKFN